MNIYEQRIIDSCALYPHHNGMMISVVLEYPDWAWGSNNIYLHTLNNGVLTKNRISPRFNNKLKNKGVMTFSHLAILRQFINENSHHRNGHLWQEIQNCVDGRYISKFEREKQELEHFFTFEAGQYKTFSVNKNLSVPDVMVFSKLLNIFKKRVFGDYIGGISSPSSEEGSPSNFSANC